VLKDGAYAWKGADDERFIDYIGAVQSIVTSGASTDSGLFEANLHDERFLPFEGAGAESTWKLDLPQDYPAFDYATITDVILHIRYTARQGVDPSNVKTALDDLFKPANPANLALLFSLRHDFPTEWSAFVNGTDAMSITVRRDHFPYFTQEKTITIKSLQFYGQEGDQHSVDESRQMTLDADHPAVTLTIKQNEVPTRSPNTEVFLVVHYALGG